MSSCSTYYDWQWIFKIVAFCGASGCVVRTVRVCNLLEGFRYITGSVKTDAECHNIVHYNWTRFLHTNIDMAGVDTADCSCLSETSFNRSINHRFIARETKNELKSNNAKAAISDYVDYRPWRQLEKCYSNSNFHVIVHTLFWSSFRTQLNNVLLLFLCLATSSVCVSTTQPPQRVGQSWFHSWYAAQRTWTNPNEEKE